MTAALKGGERSTARPGRILPPGKTRYPFYRRLGGPPGPVWTDGKSRPHRDSIPDRPARSQSLYRLSYRTHTNCYIPAQNRYERLFRSLKSDILYILNSTPSCSRLLPHCCILCELVCSYLLQWLSIATLIWQLCFFIRSLSRSFIIIWHLARIHYGFSGTRDVSVPVIRLKVVSQHLHAGIAEDILLGRQTHRLNGNSARTREENNYRIFR